MSRIWVEPDAMVLKFTQKDTVQARCIVVKPRELERTPTPFSFTLMARDNSRGIKIIFPYSVISYQSTEEENRCKTLGFLDKEYGTDFYAKWTLFEVQDSVLLKWAREESIYGGCDDAIEMYRHVKQFTLITSDEFIDIITSYDPEIQLL